VIYIFVWMLSEVFFSIFTSGRMWISDSLGSTKVSFGSGCINWIHAISIGVFEISFSEFDSKLHPESCAEMTRETGRVICLSFVWKLEREGDFSVRKEEEW